LFLILYFVLLGVGTVKWSIGQAKVKLALLSMFYLFFAFLFQVRLSLVGSLLFLIVMMN